MPTTLWPCCSSAAAWGLAALEGGEGVEEGEVVGSLPVPSPFRLAFLLANLIWAVTAVRQCYCPAPRCTPPARLTVCRLHAWCTPPTVARRRGDTRIGKLLLPSFCSSYIVENTHRPLLSLSLCLSLSLLFSLSLSLCCFSSSPPSARSGVISYRLSPAAR